MASIWYRSAAGSSTSAGKNDDMMKSTFLRASPRRAAYAHVLHQRVAPLVGAMVDDLQAVGALAEVSAAAAGVDGRAAVAVIQLHVLGRRPDGPLDELRRQPHAVAVLDGHAGPPDQVQRLLVVKPQPRAFQDLQARLREAFALRIRQPGEAGCAQIQKPIAGHGLTSLYARSSYTNNTFAKVT